MAIIYSYPTNINIQPNDIVVGTSTIVVNGKAKNQTKSFPIVDLGTYINLSNTLDSVLTNGNTSLLDAKIGELYLWDGPNGSYAKISIQDSTVRIARAGGGTDIIYSDNGYNLILNNGNASAQIINPLTISGNYILPVKTGDQTFAMLSDIPSITGFVPYTGATQSVNLGLYNLTANSIIKQGGTSTQFLMADGTVTIGNGGIYSYEIHVSQIDGNDITGTGALLNPVASITKALTLITGQRKTIIIHPGNYTESPNITVQYTVLTSLQSIGGNTLISGTVSTNTGCTISGLKMTNLTVNGVTGRGNINILNCDISGTFTKNGTADYTLIRFCDIGAVNIVSTAGVLAVLGGNLSFITVNSVGASILVKNAVCISPVVLVGSATFADCILISTGPTTNALTASAGTNIVLANSQCVIPTFQNVARVSLSGFYSIINCVFDKPNSTLVALSVTGGSTNSIVYSQFINADKFIKQGGTSLEYLMADGSVSLGSAGAVTSVGLSMPAAFSVSNSPITGAGTITVAGAGTASEYIRGDGTLANFPTSTGLTTLNGLTSQAQYFAVGTTGTDFNISSITDTHTFNLPTASAANRGALSTTDWSTFNNKANANTELNIRRTGYTVYNEFLSSVTNGSYAQATVSAGTITSPTGILDANHFGVVTFNSIAAANSGYYSALNPSATATFSCTLTTGLKTDLVFKTPVTISPTTTIRFGVGNGSITSTDFTNGFYFEIVGNSLVGKTANVSVRSSSSTYTISADTWYHLRVIATSTTLITYYVYDMNGTLLFSTTLNTNLPTTSIIMNNIVVATNSGIVATVLGYFDLISITFPPMVRGALD